MGAIQDRQDEIKRHYGTTHFWQIPNMPVQFTHRGKVYNGIVLDWSDVSRHDSDHDLCKVEVEEHKFIDYTDWNNERHVKHEVKRYIWPEPIQSYKLRKRVVSEVAS